MPFPTRASTIKLTQDVFCVMLFRKGEMLFYFSPLRKWHTTQKKLFVKDCEANIFFLDKQFSLSKQATNKAERGKGWQNKRSKHSFLLSPQLNKISCFAKMSAKQGTLQNINFVTERAKSQSYYLQNGLHCKTF